MRVLAVGAHPDDLEILCAGTLARYRAAGHDVVMAHACSGHLGHFAIGPEELRTIRRREAEAAARIIGAESVSLGFDDFGALAEREDQRRSMVDLIRWARPDVILTHAPNDYMPDHVAVSQLVFAASFGATVPHLETRYSHHPKVAPLFYFDTLAGLGFEPEEYVDITDVMDQKRAMLAAHASQVDWLRAHDGIDLLEFMDALARQRGIQCGVRYAEGFRRVRTWPRMTPSRLLP
jgi:LmbE family N-acetylglucosaminyl deacetylase